MAADFLYIFFIVLKDIPSIFFIQGFYQKVKLSFDNSLFQVYLSNYVISNVKPICVLLYLLAYLWYLYGTFEFTNARSTYLLFYIRVY